MRQSGIPFVEERMSLLSKESRIALKDTSPSGLVPFLRHGESEIWDSLAIAEYVNDLFPEKNLWPQNVSARALARSVSAEMHSGFTALRTVWPMMAVREGLKHLTTGGVQRDIDRVLEIWLLCRSRFSDEGEFLFGAFSIADAMFAPVVSRFQTYGPVDMNEICARYAQTISALPAMKEWRDGALEELASHT